MKNIFDGGFDGGFFWDVDSMYENPYNWHVVRRLGTKEYVEETLAGRNPGPVMKKVVEVRGARLDSYSAWGSY